MVVLGIVKRFSDMPGPLAVLVILGFSAPFLAFISIITGEILPSGAKTLAYGAAANMFELIISILITTPSLYVSLLMFKRKKIALILFPFSHVGATVMLPYLLSGMNKESLFLESNLYSMIFFGIISSAYIFLSSDVRYFFRQSES